MGILGWMFGRNYGMFIDIHGLMFGRNCGIFIGIPGLIFGRNFAHSYWYVKSDVWKKFVEIEQNIG